MKKVNIPLIAGLILLSQCNAPEPQKTLPDLARVSQVETGKALQVMLTAYSTTLIANGMDKTRLRIAVTDSLSREITSAEDSIRVYLTGIARITDDQGNDLDYGTDTSGMKYGRTKLLDGLCQLWLIAGKEPGKVKVEVHSGSLWPGSHEIHTVPADFQYRKPAPEQLPHTLKPIDRMIGADISWLPQLEARDMKFLEGGKQMDAIELLRNHGFNYIRLRIFVNPEHEKGYSPGEGFCGLEYTLGMARRVKDAGMKLLLDFHYSDYWADPQQQHKPAAWAGLGYDLLKDTVRAYTTGVLRTLIRQNTRPDMVQVGNEINHGLLWPEGHISEPDQLAGLLQAGVEGVEAADPSIPVMMHIALGGQNGESVFWLDNMIARGVRFDVIGISYYPRWHGTLNDLYYNLNDLAARYSKPLYVVEYNDFIKEVHDIVFNLPGELGKGACIWEPLSWRGDLFDMNREVTKVITVYDSLNANYLK